MGKTTLALHWAHRVAAAFPDGQLYVNLRGYDPERPAMDPLVSVRGFLEALGLPDERIPTDPDAQIGLYRSLIADRRVLVVLDNARDSEQVRPLLVGSGRSLVVITSRNQLTSLIAAHGATSMTLGMLTPAEAEQMLAGRLGAGRVAAEPGAIAEIIDRCARLPLALAIVAARAASHPTFPLSGLAAQLRSAEGPLDALQGGESAADARVVFSWSYRTLSTGAARLFRQLGLHAGPDISRSAAAGLAGLSARQADDHLAELVRAHLVTEHVPDRYGSHDLLRAYAAELARGLDTDTERNDSTQRMLDYYLHTAFAAAMLLNPTRASPLALPPIDRAVAPQQLSDRAEAQDWFGAERVVLFTAISYAADAGFFRHSWQLAWTLQDYCDWQGHWHSMLAMQEAAVAAAQLAADLSGQAWAERALGIAYMLLCRHEPAHRHLSSALDLYSKLQDEDGMAHCHHSLAVLLGRQQRLQGAEQQARSALTLYQRTSNVDRLPSALNSLGWCHAMLGDYEQTLTYCEQSLAAAEKIGDQYVSAAAWDSLGYAHHHLGNHASAVTCYQHGREQRRALGDRYYEADTLVHLGEAYLAAAATQDAREAWQEAWTILRELDHPDADDVQDRIRALTATPDRSASASR